MTPLERNAMKVLEERHEVVLVGKEDLSLSDLDGVRRRAYRRLVEETVESIRSQRKDGDILTGDDYNEVMNQVTVDRVDEMFLVLEYSSNDDAYFDEFGSGSWDGWNSVASFALRKDVEDLLGWDLSDPTPYKVDCPKCGVRPAEDEYDTTCPSCGVMLRLNGYIVDGQAVCFECWDENLEPATEQLPGDEYECSRCGKKYVHPKEE